MPLSKLQALITALVCLSLEVVLKKTQDLNTLNLWGSLDLALKLSASAPLSFTRFSCEAMFKYEINYTNDATLLPSSGESMWSEKLF